MEQRPQERLGRRLIATGSALIRRHHRMLRCRVSGVVGSKYEEQSIARLRQLERCCRYFGDVSLIALVTQSPSPDDLCDRKGRGSLAEDRLNQALSRTRFQFHRFYSTS